MAGRYFLLQDKRGSTEQQDVGAAILCWRCHREPKAGNTHTGLPTHTHTQHSQVSLNRDVLSQFFLVLQTQDGVGRALLGRESTRVTQMWLIWQSMSICANNTRASRLFSPSSSSHSALLKYCRRPLEGGGEACESAFGARVRYTFTGM